MDENFLRRFTFNGENDICGNLTPAERNDFKDIYYMDAKHDSQQQQRFNFDDPQQINLNGRPVGLRRQPTKYPHGLGICVQTVNDGEHYNHQQQLQNTNYSRASTLRSSWDGFKQHQDLQEMKCQSHDNQQQQQQQQSQRKYHSGMLNSPENLAELQVRRYKYPLTGNYYLDPQEASKKSPLLTFDYVNHYCKWKYLRWPLIFTVSVLVFFGLITYSIWLHDVSIARERHLQQRKPNANVDAADESNEIVTATTMEMTTLPASVTPPATERIHGLQESTILRAISTRTRIRPKEQKLTTVEYALSKGVLGWDKRRKDGVLTKKDTYFVDATTMASEEAALVPANVVRFTSGHQNSFGIPIEDDERILRLINGLFPSSEPSTTSSLSSIVKVSPTIPPVTQNKPTAPMTHNKSSISDNKCFSTSLSMCQGVLDYDLTYNVSIQLTSDEVKDYQTLMNSNCSARSVEFMCAVLEPECRPSHIGILPPCRRVCKAILEACSEIIANSDTLTATFDCNFYPDSNDPHRCEDPTRRKGFCYENEFECYDRSCIPQQWQCDNIKDCAVGEDEDNCLICDQPDEFRCRSNEKCVSETARCDMKFDCFDGSDEDDCQEFGEGSFEGGLGGFVEEDLNAFPRVFSYASILSPNQTDEKLYAYITAASDDDSSKKLTLHEVSNRTSGVSREEVTNTVPGEGPKGFVNFRDSKEIMMTSDSENKFKFSSARENRTTSRFSSSTTPLQPAASNIISINTEPPKLLMHPPFSKLPQAACAAHQLRCVSGKCITVDQLCDKIIDCPDGFDELSCTYKDRTTTQRIRGTTILPNNYNMPNRDSTNNTRADKRTIRTTTIKRKVNPLK